MPTIRNISGPYRFLFYSFDCGEPKHIHVQRDRNTCKFWLEPLSLCHNHGFSPHELNQIRRLIESNMILITEA
ncbi:MAG TPA: DUF4160 domain-containing protein [Candidatus Latescibacteria bacterium]|nr:DUF4160 domain-containing protein [Candidatus Handelsmanbacteria bacterium]HIL11692.1 DUF4160 domain-containing protein [Candidatus Latescibacterota bacterium]